MGSLAATIVRGITETIGFTALSGTSGILELHQEDSHKIHFPQKSDIFLFWITQNWAEEEIHFINVYFFQFPFVEG